MPPKMLNRTALTFVVGEDHLDRLLDLLGVRAAAGVEEVGGAPPAWATTSSVDMTSPAPLPRMPMSPSSLTYWTPALLGRRSMRVFVLAVASACVLGVAVERVAVERDLRVERLDLAVGRDDQRVDLGERRVLLDPHLVERDERVGDAVDHVGGAPPSVAIEHAPRRGEPGERVDVVADQLLGVFSATSRCPRRPRR
jgi:hypothetical protein